MSVTLAACQHVCAARQLYSNPAAIFSRFLPRLCQLPIIRHYSVQYFSRYVPLEYLKRHSGSADAFQTNVDTTTSNCAVLGFLTYQIVPQPYPNETLVNYQLLFDTTDDPSQTTTMNLTLASLARVDGQANGRPPGSRPLQIDTPVIMSVNFALP